MTKIPGERVVAGLSCGEVLDRLSDYLDGDLDQAARDQVEGHLRGCDGCARFSSELQSTVRALRAHLTRSARLSAAVRDRLRRALDEET